MLQERTQEHSTRTTYTQIHTQMHTQTHTYARVEFSLLGQEIDLFLKARNLLKLHFLKKQIESF